MRRTFWLLVALVLATFLLGTSTAEAANSITVADRGGDVGQHTSMVLDGSGNPVVSYYDAANGDLKVFCANAFPLPPSTSSPDTTDDVGQYTSLAVDSNGYPVVSYYDVTNESLKLMHCNDANCQTAVGGPESIATPDTGGTGDVGRYTSLALDGAGKPVVSYYDATNGNLKLLHCDDVNCSGDESGNIKSVDTGGTGDVGRYTSLRLDGGKPVVSYYDVTNGDLKVLKCNDANCDPDVPEGSGAESIESPDTGGNVGAYTSLVLAGNPAISYYDVTNGDLKVMRCGDINCSSGNFIISPDAAGAVGAYTSLEVNSSNQPVVSYYDLDNGDLKVLHCGNGVCTISNSITSADTAGNVGAYVSLALSGDNPVVSYYDATNGFLKVLRCSDASCTGGGETIATADPGGNVGAYSSLVLDSSGKPVVSYQDEFNGNLKVLHCNDANCAGGDETPTSPDTAGNVGLYTSLALDGDGYPVVSYYDLGNGNLKVLHCNDADCAPGGDSIKSPDTANDVGLDTSLALDASGNPVVSYWDYTNMDLKVMHCNDPNCDPTVPQPNGAESILSPDTQGNVGSASSLVLDVSGNPVVSYHGNGDLKVMHCNDPNCDPAVPQPNGAESIESPDTEGSVGGATSLVLDGSGNPVVSYYDMDNDRVKLLHCNDANCAPDGDSVAVLEVVGNEGFTSLALDLSGNPVVAYRHQANGALRVMHCNDPNCAPGGDSIASPDTVANVGGWPSLALYGGVLPVVSYYGQEYWDLKVLHCDTPTCTAPASYPPAGTDVLPVSLHFADVWLDEDDNGVPETPVGAVTFSGTGKFSRGIPYMDGVYNTINTAILSMELHGMVGVYPVTIKAGTEQGLPPSPGKIREQMPGTLFPADTWYDVFFEIVGDPDYGTLRNCNFGGGSQSVRLNGVTMAIPATYVQYFVPSCPLAPPPASCAVACQVVGGLSVASGVIPLSPMRMCTGYDPSGNAIWVTVGGIAEWPGTAAGADLSADSSAGSGFNCTALGAALGAAAVALAAGAWFARRRWAR